MIQTKFVDNVVALIPDMHEVIGLAIGGSWISDEIDEYSDLDFVLVTENKISGDKNKMLEYAAKFGNLVSGFTGEHVGEPRVLICLYDHPLLHVDIKFVTLEEFQDRVEDPIVLYEREGALTKVITETKSQWPKLDYQWIEDRFWIWIHYAALKIGRGEYFEALDFLSYLRVTVISPLMQLRNGELPRGLRKVEFNFIDSDVRLLQKTVPTYNAYSIGESIKEIIHLYRDLREGLFDSSVNKCHKTENLAVVYLDGVLKKL